MISFTYLSFLHDLSLGRVVPGVDTFKAMFVSSGYTPTDAHTRRSDVTAAEVAGTNYPAGGTQCLIGVNKNVASARIELSLSVSPVPNASITTGGIVVYKSRGGLASQDELVCAVSFGGDKTVSNFTLSPTMGTPLYITKAP